MNVSLTTATALLSSLFRSYHYGEGPEFNRMSYESVGRVRSADDGLSYYMGKRYAAMQGGSFNDSEFVFVDAHVLSTPTIADINQDGHMEVSPLQYSGFPSSMMMTALFVHCLFFLPDHFLGVILLRQVGIRK